VKIWLLFVFQLVMVAEVELTTEEYLVGKGHKLFSEVSSGLGFLEYGILGSLEMIHPPVLR
jgi:hypothetical protein